MTLYGGSRRELRARYRQAWQRYRQGLPLQPLELQIADVVRAHPEYHALLESESGLEQEFPPQGARENPFLHLSLHLAVREQVLTDRPGGIADIHRRLSSACGSLHEAEHRMIEVLAASLWEAQASGRPGDEALYLERLRRL